MGKVYCQHHKDKELMPAMIYFGDNSIGKQFICAVCSGVRVFNVGEIVSLKNQYGFIKGKKEDIFFHFSNLAYDYKVYSGMKVSFEISFLENDRLQAINIKPANGGNNGD